MIAYHSIFGMYGFWLPNDPRGSGSDFVASWELLRYGPATKVHASCSVAARPHDVRSRLQAKHALRFPDVKLTGRQALAVAEGFAQACREGIHQLHACAILPDHVHLVIGAHRRGIRTIVGHLRSRATSKLREQGLWDDRPVWGAHGCNVFLDDMLDARRAIAYVEANPEEEGKRRQHWSFVVPLVATMLRDIRSEDVQLRRVGGAVLDSHRTETRRKRRG